MIDRLRAALREAPNDADIIASLAGALAQAGQLDEARAFLEAAHARNPQAVAVAHNLAELYRNSGEAERAEPMLQALAGRTPPYPPSVVSLIAMFTQRLQAASHTLAQLAHLHAMHGAALRAQGQYGLAEQAFRQASVYAPHDLTLQGEVAEMMRLMGRPSEAVRACATHLSHHDGDAGAWNNLGCALVDLGRLEEAQPCFERSLALAQPSTHVAWQARHNLGSGAMLNYLYRPNVSPHELYAMHRDWGQAMFPELPPRPAQTFDGQRLCRIGLVSGDFRYHAMGYFIAPLLTHLDPERFELFCYDTAPGADSVAQRLHALPLHWRDVRSLDDAALAARMRADALDLVLDLMGHTQGTRLCTLTTRPAPVMATWLGYPFTTGFAGFDYRIADVWTDPTQTQNINTEALALLPRSQFCYHPLSDAPPAKTLPADANGGRVTFGSRNAVRKINADVVRAWADILKAMPDSCLLLQASGLDDLGTVARVTGLFEAFGVDAQRLLLEGFNPSFDSIRTYDRIDVALDTFPFNGGATTCDALWMGVPVVTLAGKTSFGRMGASILSALGQEDWVTHTVDDYVAQVLALASDLPRLRQLRQTLRAQMTAGPLCDEAGFAKDFGELLLQLARTQPRSSQV